MNFMIELASAINAGTRMRGNEDVMAGLNGSRAACRKPYGADFGKVNAIHGTFKNNSTTMSAMQRVR